MARKNPKRNISRIETKGPSGKVYGGWEVRIQRKGKKTEKFFSDNGHGGRRAALAAAKEFRDELESKYEKYSVAEMAKKPSKRNKSGMVGVRLHKQVDQRGDYEYHYWYWVAQWTDGRGRRRTKSFSVHQYGDQEAYRLAGKAREEGVSAANR
jgi:hypothetical protein